jgi:hypothetical protein
MITWGATITWGAPRWPLRQNHQTRGGSGLRGESSGAGGNVAPVRIDLGTAHRGPSCVRARRRAGSAFGRRGGPHGRLRDGAPGVLLLRQRGRRAPRRSQPTTPPGRVVAAAGVARRLNPSPQERVALLHSARMRSFSEQFHGQYPNIVRGAEAAGAGIEVHQLSNGQNVSCTIGVAALQCCRSLSCRSSRAVHSVDDTA